MKGTNLLSHPLLLITVALVIGLADPFALFLLLPRASPKEYVVDKGILQECQEHKDKAAHEVHINSLDVGDLGESLSQMSVDGSHCKYSGDPCKERVGALLLSASPSLLAAEQLQEGWEQCNWEEN